MEGSHGRVVLGDGPVEIEVRSASLERITLAVAFSSVSMRVERARQTADDYLLQFPFDGSVAAVIDGRAFAITPPAGLVISPSQNIVRTGQPGWMLVAQIPTPLVRSRLGPGAGRRRRNVAFQPLISSAANELRSYCMVLVDAIDRGRTIAGSAMSEVLERGLVDLLLTLQSHTESATLVEALPDSPDERVRAVVDYVKSGYGASFTVDRLAKVAGCSVRSLQDAFHRLFGMGPMEHVRRMRLSFARELLEAGSPGLTVTEVARRSGHGQLSRFAGAYRDQFGESPSETIQRARLAAATAHH
jgi:AraC-like DNA-binding protein